MWRVSFFFIPLHVDIEESVLKAMKRPSQAMINTLFMIHQHPCMIGGADTI